MSSFGGLYGTKSTFVMTNNNSSGNKQNQMRVLRAANLKVNQKKK